MVLRQLTAEELWCEDLGPAIRTAAEEIFLEREAGLPTARLEARAFLERDRQQNDNVLVIPVDMDAVVERYARQICETRLKARGMDNIIPEGDIRAAERLINERVALKLASGMPVALHWPDAKSDGSLTEMASRAVSQPQVLQSKRAVL